MRVEGEADELSLELFPHGLVPQILRLIVDTWASLKRPAQDEDEPKITNRFVGALQYEGRLRRVRFRIMPHVKDVEKLNPETGKGFVEIDIYVPYGYESRCYFGIEAKKLNTVKTSGKWESQAGEYAGKEGMGCFIDGRYSEYQCEGAMVGYVMDSDCARAKASIADAIEKRSCSLGVRTPCALDPAVELGDFPDAFQNAPHSESRTLHGVPLAIGRVIMRMDI